MLKNLLGDTLQGILKAETDQKLGYSKYDYQNKVTDDSRNGYSQKTDTSSLGEIELVIPRDHKSESEPQIVRKNLTDISNIEDQVQSMYAKDMTTRDISAHRKLLMATLDGNTKTLLPVSELPCILSLIQ